MSAFNQAWQVVKGIELREALHTTRGSELKPLKRVEPGEQGRGSKSPTHMKRHEGSSSRGKMGDKRDKGMGGKKITNVDAVLDRIDRKIKGGERRNSQ